MPVSIGVNLIDVIVWLIVGGIAGSLAGMLVKRKREGFGKFVNLFTGLIGAIVGGFLFRFFPDFGLDDIKISLKDVLAALVGSLLFIYLWGFIKSRFSRKTNTTG